MKTILLIACSFICRGAFAQQIKDFPGTYTMDSIKIILKQNPAWVLPDTATLRAIAPRLKGFAYLSATKYKGDNYIEMEMRKPIRKLVANEMNINDAAYFSLVVIPQ
jgi:hypothetical protein